MDRSRKLILNTTFCLESADIGFSTHESILISFSRIDKLEYTCSFNNGLFELMFQSGIVSNGIVTDGLYELNVNELCQRKNRSRAPF